MAARWIKRLALGTAEACRINALARLRNAGGLTVVCYHGVVERPRQGGLFGNTTGAAEFAAQLDYIGAHFRPVTAAELTAGLDGARPLPHNALAITFDDGYRNNLTQAAPLLRAKGIPAIFHLSTGYIGGRAILWPDEILLRLMDWPGDGLPAPDGRSVSPGASRFEAARAIKEACKRIFPAAREEFLARLRAGTPATPSGYDAEAHEFMSWDEARSLVSMGFDLGSHTVSHPILSGLDGAALRQELSESRAVIRGRTGSECLTLAYPNGGTADFSAEVLQAAAESGYAVAFSVQDLIAGAAPPRLAVPRVAIPGHAPLPVFYARVSGLYAALRRPGGRVSGAGPVQ